MRALILAVVIVVGCATNGGPGNERADLSIETDDGGVAGDASFDESPTDLACPVDLMPTATCGKCGKATQSCIDGKVVIGACLGETGVCAPGDIVYAPDKCQIKTCSKDCKWSIWLPAPGVQCTHDQQCNAGPDCDRVGTRKCIMCKLSPTCLCL